MEDLHYSLANVKVVDSQFYASLTWLQCNEVTEDHCLTFCMTEDSGGEVNAPHNYIFGYVPSLHMVSFLLQTRFY